MSGDFGLPELRVPRVPEDAVETDVPAGHHCGRVLLVVLVLVVVVGAGAVVGAVRGERADGSLPPARSAGSARSSTTPASAPGWRAVVGREGVAYDVPPSWRVEEAGTITGFEHHDDTDARLVTMHDLASYRSGACPTVPGSARARAGFVSPRGGSATGAAPELSQRWAEVAALQLGGRVTDVSPTQTSTRRLGAGTTAAEATTLVRFPHPEVGCQAPAMTVTAVSFVAHGAVVAFVLWTDEQVPDAVTSVDATRVLRSLRVVG